MQPLPCKKNSLRTLCGLGHIQLVIILLSPQGSDENANLGEPEHVLALSVSTGLLRCVYCQHFCFSNDNLAKVLMKLLLNVNDGLLHLRQGSSTILDSVRRSLSPILAIREFRHEIIGRPFFFTRELPDLTHTLA